MRRPQESNVQELHDSSSDPAIKDEALAVLRNLVERVVVSPLPDSFQVELVGAIANMLSPPDQGPELDGYGSSVKGVAGAGFEPATFRL